MTLIRYLGAGCFWIFSSESLVLLGNSAGYGVMQTAIVLLLLAPALIYGLTVRGDARPGGRHEEVAVGGHTGLLLAVTGFAGIVCSSLFVPTGILVSAGFTFNEVFFYRFPNFAFAFLLLTAAVIAQYLSDERKELLVGLLTSGAAGLLVLLVLLGIMDILSSPERLSGITDVGDSGEVFWPLIFLFLGFERMTAGNRGREASGRICIGFTAGLFLLLLWGTVSALLVVPERLAESTIPHMLAAGKIASPWGRHLMGAAVICSCLAVTIQFFSISNSFLSSTRLLPSAPRFKKAVPLIFGTVICVLMFGGLAGSDRIESLIRASLLLWLIHAGLVMVIRGMREETPGIVSRYSLFISGGTALAGSLAVIVFQRQYGPDFVVLVLFLAGSILCITLLQVIRRLCVLNYEKGGI